MPSGYAIAALGAYIICTFFTVYPISIPTPRPLPQIKLDFTTAPVIAILALWATQCLDLTVIRNGMIGTGSVKPYGIIILFFSLTYIATSLDITGAIRTAAFWVANRGCSNARMLYLYFNVTLTILVIFLGKSTIMLSGTVFLVHYTAVTELDSRAWTMAHFATMNAASMVLFVGNPTNVVICEGFGINNATFTAYTIFPFLASYICCFGVWTLQYREQVPWELPRSFVREPREALLDPAGAWVGGFMLITTLVLCAAASSFDIDAWKISLPFAAAKCLFDFGWDYHRYSCGIPMLGRGLPMTVRVPSIEKNQPMTTMHATSSFSSVTDEDQARAASHVGALNPPVVESRVEPMESQSLPNSEGKKRVAFIWKWDHSYIEDLHDRLDQRFPTFAIALSRLPFSFILFMFSQFILIEALDHQGWVNMFSDWLLRTTRNQIHPTIWLVGVLGIILCNISGTNIGATILLTKVIRAAALSSDAGRGAAIALAVASNIGATGFVFAASLTGMWWRSILDDEGRPLNQRDFALANILPLLTMATVGFGVVSAEIAVLSGS